MTSYRFFKTAAGFSFRDGTRLRRWISICLPNFDEISQSTAKKKLLPVSVDFYLFIVVIGMPFCISLPNFILIGRSATKLWHNTDISRRRPELKIYFRVRFYWWHSLGKMEIYLHIKFRLDISIHDWDKTTSAFGKRPAAILEFYFRFWFCPNFRHRRDFLHWPNKFRQNRTTLGGAMMSYRFFQEATSSHIGFDLGNIRPPKSAIVGLSLIFKFRLDRIYSFGDIAIFIFLHFCLKLPIPSNFWESWGIFLFKLFN